MDHKLRLGPGGLDLLLAEGLSPAAGAGGTANEATRAPVMSQKAQSLSYKCKHIPPVAK